MARLIMVAALFLFVAGMQARVSAEEETRPGAAAADRCVDAALCPRFDEIYATTPPFRHALATALRHCDNLPPEWVKGRLPWRGKASHAPQAGQERSNTASAVLPIRIDTKHYLLGRMEAPDRGDERIAVLYNVRYGTAAVHYQNANGKHGHCGNDEEIVRKVMTDYVNPSSPFALSIGRPSVGLPIPVQSR